MPFIGVVLEMESLADLEALLADRLEVELEEEEAEVEEAEGEPDPDDWDLKTEYGDDLEEDLPPRPEREDPSWIEVTATGTLDPRRGEPVPAITISRFGEELSAYPEPLPAFRRRGSTNQQIQRAIQRRWTMLSLTGEFLLERHPQALRAETVEVFEDQVASAPSSQKALVDFLWERWTREGEAPAKDEVNRLVNGVFVRTPACGEVILRAFFQADGRKRSSDKRERMDRIARFVLEEVTREPGCSDEEMARRINERFKGALSAEARFTQGKVRHLREEHGIPGQRERTQGRKEHA